MDIKIKEAIELLNNSKSAKRESGAKRLRKMESIDSGLTLLQVLEKEIKDKRTWSTQYHLILALGHSKYEKALPFLLELAEQDFETTILYYGLGDSIFRLSILSDSVENTLEKIYSFNNYQLIYGAFQALALLHLIPNDKTIKEIIEKGRDENAIEFVEGYPNDKRGLRLWVAAACAGWKNELKFKFLDECEIINDDLLRLAVENSRKGKYVKWGPY